MAELDSSQIDALCDAAATGVNIDGLRVHRSGHTYQFSTPAETYTGVTAEKLRHHAIDHADYVTNWYFWRVETRNVTVPQRAFLRWLERADVQPVSDRYNTLSTGTTRSWGQLKISTRLAASGLRVYDIRHEDDDHVRCGTTGSRGNRVDTEIQTYSDPMKVQELVKYDEKGRYRPLKSAPTLTSGWEFAGVKYGDLLSILHYVYPATIENWHLERTDALDITHFREAARRQTGIYDIVDELPIDAVAAAVEACCDDSQCLKRRMWDEDGETHVDVPRGDGEFPCREPCSLFLTAVRKFVTLDREEPRTYEFELTPTEKQQLETILDTVATGTIDAIREGDVNHAANRFRTRYLRALRMTERGLSDTPTYAEDYDE